MVMTPPPLMLEASSFVVRRETVTHEGPGLTMPLPSGLAQRVGPVMAPMPVSMHASVLPFVLTDTVTGGACDCSCSDGTPPHQDENAAIGVTVDTLRVLRMTHGTWVAITSEDGRSTRSGRLCVVAFDSQERCAADLQRSALCLRCAMC